MLLLLKDIEIKGILDPVSDVATGSGPETRIADPREIDSDPSLERKKTRNLDPNPDPTVKKDRLTKNNPDPEPCPKL